MKHRKKQPNPPPSLGKCGRKFWAETLAVYDLEDAHHLRLLENAARCLDRAAEARVQIDKLGIVVNNRFGEARENPACNTERQSMQVFRQAIRELGLDLDDGPVEVRGPRRPGTWS